METWILWLALACVLLIVEIMTGTLWCLCFAAVCLLTMGAALLGASLDIQLVVLAITGLLSYFLLMPFFKHQRFLKPQPDTSNARTGMDALLGRTAYVTEEIRPGRLGRARIDGDNWQVRAPGLGNVIPRGTEVKVTGFDSIILQVAPYDPLKK